MGDDETERERTSRSRRAGRAASGWLSVMDVSKVEGGGQQHDAYVCREPRPEVMSEDQDIRRDDGDDHHGHHKYGTRSASHPFFLLRAGLNLSMRPNGTCTALLTTRG